MLNPSRVGTGLPEIYIRLSTVQSRATTSFVALVHCRRYNDYMGPEKLFFWLKDSRREASDILDNSARR